MVAVNKYQWDIQEMYMIWPQRLYLMKELKREWASLVAQMVKNLPAVQRPGFDPWVRKIPWRRRWQPTPIFLSGESQRSLTGCSLWVRKESDMTWQLIHTHVRGNDQGDRRKNQERLVYHNPQAGEGLRIAQPTEMGEGRSKDTKYQL